MVCEDTDHGAGHGVGGEFPCSGFVIPNPDKQDFKS